MPRQTRSVQARKGSSPSRAARTIHKKEQRSIDAISKWFQQKNIRKVKLGGFDVDGVLRGKYLSLEKFLSSAQGGLGFCDVVFGWDVSDNLYDNAQVTGWHTGYPDMQARVDLSSGRIIPWEPDTAAFLLDFVYPDGSPFEPSPRQLLKRISQKAKDLGVVAKFGAEFEFFLFQETPQSAHDKGFAHLTPLSPGMFGYSWLRTSQHTELVHALIDGLNAFEIPVEGFHTETGPGVYETAIRYGDLEASADRAALFKVATKEICSRYGVLASFMAKWNPDLPGCSGHMHQSLWSLRGDPLFYAATEDAGLSNTLRHYLGGQLALMPEFTALYWPTVNSYKRSVENTWAPTTATWGLENRTCAIRVLGGSAKSTRVEFRQTGADMNPYIGMAASLAAGLWGIENKIEPPPPCLGNGYQAKAPPLPRNLKDATALLAKSSPARELLGEGFVDHYVRTREWEVRAYERAVTNWELERYMELV